MAYWPVFHQHASHGIAGPAGVAALPGSASRRMHRRSFIETPRVIERADLVTPGLLMQSPPA